MDEFLEQLNYWLQQAYVYIPIVLSFISAIGIPALVQIAKIFASAKLYVEEISVVKKKANETVEKVNSLSSSMKSFADEEREFLEKLAKSTYNKKERAVIMKRAKEIEDEFANAGGFIETLPETESKKSKKKVKVKVRIRKDEAGKEGRTEKAQ